jgi:hypothetical protein
MRDPVRRRATAVALAALVAFAAVAPVAADSRPRKTYPTHQERYRVGRAMTPSTDILSASGYAAWMIDEALGRMTPLPRLGSAFLRAERKEGLNARYFIAHALLESGWGASDIARFKRNLFGYNAFDRDPWKYASSFRTYEKGIMAVAEKIRDSYLTPSGRFFYRYTTLRAMNVYYASDPNWATKIAYLANVVDRRVVTLRERGLRFGSARLAAPARAGARIGVDVPWSARPGAVLPSRLRFAVRWTPLELVAADAAEPAPAPLPRWTFVGRRDLAGRTARLAVAVPSRPGTWRLDVEARDSDGQPLPRTDRPAVRSLTVRVTAAQEVSVALAAGPEGRLQATIRNVGTRPLAAWRSGAATTLEAWALPLDPSKPAYRLAERPLDTALRPGASRVVRFAAPRDPAVVIVRVAGDPDAVGRHRQVAALVERGRGRRIDLSVLPVASPRDDALLRRTPAGGRIALEQLDEPVTLRAAVEPDAARARATEEVAAAEAAPGVSSLLVRSLAAEPGRDAQPSATLVPLPNGQRRTIALDVTGIPAGVRLVVAGIVPPDGGPLDASTLRLAWVPIVPVPDAPAAPH